jgi:hydrogenase-1 operon protein HyaF
MNNPRPFPIPVVAALGPGSQEDDEPMNVMVMPRDMATFQAPSLPEPEELAAHTGALQALHAALSALRRRLAGEEVATIDLGGLSVAERTLVNQVLGEGEVAARVRAELGQGGVEAQESVFAGVWRVLHTEAGQVVSDTLEVGAVPQAVLHAAREDGAAARPLGTLPAGVMNAPSLYEELSDRSRRWRPGDPAHVINLTLLPLSEADSLWLQGQLDEGRVTILSRGYGNCRVVDTLLARTWRVTYFNAQDMIILDTLEVGSVPEVACAAVQDLEDSAERLAEVLQWVEQA